MSRTQTLIGILSKPQHLHLLQSFAKQARKHANLCVFTPNDVQWQKKQVNAYVASSRGTWQRRLCPLPDVIYNRYLSDRKQEWKASFVQFRRQLEQHNIPYFNWSYFNKQQIFKLIQQTNNQQSIQHLPETEAVRNRAHLSQFISKHRLVFLKPTGGFAGIGIYRMVSKHAHDAQLHFHQGRKPILMKFATREAMVDFVHRKTRGFRRYIAQQGIHLLRYKDCPLDFRVHCNRNAKNEWVVSGIGAKKAGKGSVTTHKRTGGRIYHPLPILRYFFREQADQVYRQLQRTATRLATTIANQHPHLIGELGFDFGIDQSGKYWMFEANAKPGRAIFHHPALRHVGKRATQHIIDYCLFLAQRAKGGTGA
jgi:hypothetical protein